MNPSRWRAIAGMTAFLAVAPAVTAQQFAPHVGYVYPAGGRQGATFQVTVGGQFLDGVANAFVSGRGVQAAVVEHTKPLTPQEFNRLREKLKELTDKKSAAFKQKAKGGGQDGPQASAPVAWTAEDEKMVDDIRKKLATFPRRPVNPAIAENVVLQVTMAPDAEPGERELRLGTPSGLTNPLVFCVGQLAEFSEEPAKPPSGAGFAKGQKYGAARLSSDAGPQSTASDTEMRITLPAVVNGQITPTTEDWSRFQGRQAQPFTPGDVDRYRFEARKGQQLIVAASAQRLIPYLADAVPGWFQATLALYDAKGREVAYADDFLFHPDPVIHYEVPDDGEYVIEIKDAIYRGREDFVYRIAAGELPFVTGIFPLGGQAGAQTTVELAGWNLPVKTLTVDARDKAPGIETLFVRKGEWVSNRVPFAVDTLPDCAEQEPNNDPGNVQKVKAPLIVNGRIGQAGDWDVFAFEGGAGEEIVAEVHARRLDSPLDSVLKLTDAAGKQLAINDDHEDKGAGLTTHHADSWLRASLPAAGTYCLHVGDAQRKGGPEYAYRLRISPPRPDFDLRIVPASVNVRVGTAIPLTVYAFRKDGFSEQITVVLKDAPPGFTLTGGRVPANQDRVRVTLTAPTTPGKDPVSVRLEGRAVIQGREVVRQVVPAEDMMQAFAYRHLVPCRELEVAVSGRYKPKAAVTILSPGPVKIPAGGTARVQAGIATNTFFGKIVLELSEPPEGISIAQVSPVGLGTEIVLKSDAAKVKPGLAGNLIVNVFLTGKNPDGAEKGKPQGNDRRAALGTLPAIPFEITPP